jgi:hypothetical protein
MGGGMGPECKSETVSNRDVDIHGDGGGQVVNTRSVRVEN